MIFDCPTCGAENGVPVSAIGEDGHVLRCRRCGDAFRVFPPDDTDTLDGTGHDEETLALQDPDWDGPSEATSTTGLGSDPAEATVRAPGGSMPDSEALPQGADEEGLDPELGDTREVDRAEHLGGGPLPWEDDPSEAVASKPLPRQPPEPPEPSERSGAVERADGLEDDEEDSAGGFSSDVVPGLTARSRSGLDDGGSVPDGSVPDGTAASVMTGPRKIAAALNAAPLALKAAVVVFPVALGIALLLSPGEKITQVPDPISIPAGAVVDAGVAAIEAPVDAAVVAAVAPADPDPDPEAIDAVEPPIVDPSPPGLASDVPAEDGQAFIDGAGVRLRARPDARGALVAKLALGQTVQIYGTVGDWLLVHDAPDGAAGFVRKDLTSARRPIGALALELAFESCVARRSRRSKKACLQRAEASLLKCFDRCAGDPPANSQHPLVSRCKQACEFAFVTCRDKCKKRRRRRRR